MIAKARPDPAELDVGTPGRASVNCQPLLPVAYLRLADSVSELILIFWTHQINNILQKIEAGSLVHLNSIMV